MLFARAVVERTMKVQEVLMLSDQWTTELAGGGGYSGAGGPAPCGAGAGGIASAAMTGCRIAGGSSPRPAAPRWRVAEVARITRLYRE